LPQSLAGEGVWREEPQPTREQRGLLLRVSGGEEGAALPLQVLERERLDVAVVARLTSGWILGLLAETYLVHGQPEQALLATEDAIQRIRTSAGAQFERFVLCSMLR
jgi:hypothetical protein